MTERGFVYYIVYIYSLCLSYFTVDRLISVSTHRDSKDSVSESFNHLSIFMSCLVWIIFSTPEHFVSNFFCVMFTLLIKDMFLEDS